MVTILTDSCADLSPQLLDEYHLRSIPLHVLVGGEDHLDGTLSLDALFRSVEQTGELPKTAAPSVQEFLTLFNNTEPKVYIGLSSQLSATMANAKLAVEQRRGDELHLVDSLNLSTGIGLLALKAADLRDAGLEAPAIAAEIEATRPKVRTAFVIDTMDYLHKGGRCTGLQAFVGSMLKIRPVIHVREDGTLGVLDKVRGTRQKALESLLAKFEADLPEIDLKHVFVTHTGCTGDAKYLQKSLNELTDIENVHITTAGATIASHCGPDTIGILYIKK